MMLRRLLMGGALLALTLAMSPSAASAGCVVKRFATLDLTMEGTVPVVRGEINGHPVRFFIGSASFYSTISPAAARELGLSVKAIPSNIGIRWNGATGPAGRANVESLKLANWNVGSTDFIVGGNYDREVGVIGQNILGLRDVEYDLGHGLLRLAHAENCLGASPVYWAAKQLVMSLPIEAMEDFDQSTVGAVLVNGIKLRALFNDGASGSAISPKAAAKLGVAPGKADGKAVGTGDGGNSAKLDRIDIGEETLRGGTLGVRDLGNSEVDITIGSDFFLAHRIYVANQMHRMYFTYESGPVFGVIPTQGVAPTSLGR